VKILVTGKNGQLGKSINKVILDSQPLHKFLFIGKDELDFSNSENISNYFTKNNFDGIINCAAYTNVEKAELEIELANEVNYKSVEELAKISKKLKMKLIHISTDYVFDGKVSNSYLEVDSTNPVNVYGRTKLAGEMAIIEIMKSNALVIRTSWLYSEFGNNFVNTILKLSKKKKSINVIGDQFSSPTFATDLAKAILLIINGPIFAQDQHETKLYHYSNEGECSWASFAKKIVELSNNNCEVKDILSSDYDAMANRPQKTTLNKARITEEFNLKIPHWKKSLKKCIEFGVL